MAQFTNQAQLSYNGSVINSNVAVGEILEVLSATKTAVLGNYTRGERITYVISAINSGSTPITGLTVTDNLGAYPFNEQTLYPLSYVEGSVLLYINGVLSSAPSVVSGPPLAFSGINLPPNGSMLLIYEASINQFAPLSVGDSIVNTAEVGAATLIAPLTVSETVTPEAAPELTITKSIEPVPVTENALLTYRFILQNLGNTPAVATDNVILSDTFDPLLSGITVTLNGVVLEESVGYTYNETTGEFATIAGQITVPAATYEQDAVSGAWVITPGTTTLTVTGTV